MASFVDALLPAGSYITSEAGPFSQTLIAVYSNPSKLLQHSHIYLCGVRVEFLSQEKLN